MSAVVLALAAPAAARDAAGIATLFAVAVALAGAELLAGHGTDNLVAPVLAAFRTGRLLLA